MTKEITTTQILLQGVSELDLDVANYLQDEGYEISKIVKISFDDIHIELDYYQVEKAETEKITKYLLTNGVNCSVEIDKILIEIPIWDKGFHAHRINGFIKLEL